MALVQVRTGALFGGRVAVGRVGQRALESDGNGQVLVSGETTDPPRLRQGMRPSSQVSKRRRSISCKSVVKQGGVQPNQIVCRDTDVSGG